MSGHVIYESRLELTRLLYADFDPGTEAVLAQPFLLSARVDGGKRRHVPDFLILRRGMVPLVVDVKPRHLLTRPKVAFSLGWAREAVESRGWEFEAWPEPPEAELANVRFLAGYRRAWLFDPELVAEIRSADLDGATLGEAFLAFPRRPAELVRAGVLHLLWAQHLVTDLAAPLSARHRLRTGVPAEVTGAGTRELPRPAPVGDGQGKPGDEEAGCADRGAHMGQAGVRVGVGTRFAYDGELVTVVEMFASSHGNEILVRDGRDRRFRLSLREALASGRARVIPDGPGPSSDEPRETASVILDQLTAEALKEVRERAADVNEVLSGYRSGSGGLAGPGEPRPEYAPGVPLMQRYAAKAAERGVSVRTVKRWVAGAREGREAALAGEIPAREAGSGGLGRADPRWVEMALEIMGEHKDESTPGKAKILQSIGPRLAARYPGEEIISNHFKYIANEFPVTLLFVGVGLAERGLFGEIDSDGDESLAQTGRRTTALTLDPFLIDTDEQRHHWRSLLLAIERRLVLTGKYPGMLADHLPDYLFARSTGHIGSLMTLVARGCQRAIRTGAERLDTGLLDQVKNDAAAESARARLEASLAAGRLTSRPRPAGRRAGRSAGA